MPITITTMEQKFAEHGKPGMYVRYSLALKYQNPNGYVCPNILIHSTLKIYLRLLI
jgi:hypothetical protein